MADAIQAILRLQAENALLQARVEQLTDIAFGLAKRLDILEEIVLEHLGAQELAAEADAELAAEKPEPWALGGALITLHGDVAVPPPNVPPGVPWGEARFDAEEDVQMARLEAAEIRSDGDVELPRQP